MLIICQVDVKAVPIDKKDLADTERVSQLDPMTFGGHPQPPLDVPYEVTINNKTCFYAITVMKAYQNYSFEELRFMSPALKRSSESMLVRPNGDGSYSATWTPSSIGWYSLMVTVDGYNVEDVSYFQFHRIDTQRSILQSFLLKISEVSFYLLSCTVDRRGALTAAIANFEL